MYRSNIEVMGSVGPLQNPYTISGLSLCATYCVTNQAWNVSLLACVKWCRVDEKLLDGIHAG